MATSNCLLFAIFGRQKSITERERDELYLLVTLAMHCAGTERKRSSPSRGRNKEIRQYRRSQGRSIMATRNRILGEKKKWFDEEVEALDEAGRKHMSWDCGVIYTLVDVDITPNNEEQVEDGIDTDRPMITATTGQFFESHTDKRVLGPSCKTQGAGPGT